MVSSGEENFLSLKLNPYHNFREKDMPVTVFKVVSVAVATEVIRVMEGAAIDYGKDKKPLAANIKREGISSVRTGLTKPMRELMGELR